MNILVTGGLGYIGSHILTKLKNKKYSIYILDNLDNSKTSTYKILKNLNPNIKELKIIDLKNRKHLTILKKENLILFYILLVINLCLNLLKNQKDYYKNNIIGFVNLVEAMEKFKVNKLIYSSSATVYESNIFKAIKESDNLYTNSIYGFTKKTIEDIIFLKKKFFRLQYIILRYFNPAGCDESGLLGEENNKIPNNLYPFIGSIIQKKQKYLKIFGKNYKTID